MSHRSDPHQTCLAGVAVLIAIACMSGAAWAADLALPSGGVFRVPVTSLKEARSRTTVFQQHDFSCGSAAVATLLTFHYGHRVTEQEVFRAMFEKGDQAKIRKEGFSLLDMKNFLASRGYQANGFKEPLAKLERNGLPAIVLIQDNGYRHFVVVKGVKEGRVLLGDPAVGLRAMSIPDFEAKWPNRILFVVLNNTKQARANVPAEWATKPRAPIHDRGLRDNVINDLMRRQPGDLM